MLYNENIMELRIKLVNNFETRLHPFTCCNLTHNRDQQRQKCHFFVVYSKPKKKKNYSKTD